MKVMLGGQKFTSDTEEQSVICQWLDSTQCRFFPTGIQNLVEIWNNYTKALEQYVGNGTLINV